MEKKIVEARISGPSFCQLQGSEIRYFTDQIIFRGAAISGCPMPTTEGFAEILSEEIVIFINDYGFGELTVDEILMALRLNAKGGLRYPSGTEVERVSFIGVCFSVDFLSKVLSNYMAIRNILDGKLKNFIDGY